jgi:hypothetical protein
VVGALTQARMNGLVAPEAEPPAKDLFVFNKTARLLQRFGERLQGLFS